jgi:MOSC domain-containing protein YiiM
MAEGIADLLQQNPSLVHAAKGHLDRLLREGQGSADADLTEWRRILDTYSTERVRNLLTSTSSRAERLRQSSPFFAVLSAKERDELMLYLEERA